MNLDTSPEALRALRRLAERATRGPWCVSTTQHPFRLVRYDGTVCAGAHTEHHIVTVRDHPQSKAPDPIVTISVGAGIDDGPPVHKVYIRPEDADYIAAVSPEVVLALLDALAAEKESATVKPDLTVGEEVTPLKAVAVMGVRPPLAQESSPIISTTVDLRTLAGAATPGPWQVVTYRTPFSITRHDGTTCSGEHVGRDIATVRHHPQSHAPYPIVTLGIGVTQETPVHFVFIRPEDADYLAAVSPEVVLALLDTIDALRASLAAAEKERDEALRDAIEFTQKVDAGLVRDEEYLRLHREKMEQYDRRVAAEARAEKAEAERGKLIMALDHLLYPKPASGTRVYTLPDGQRECLTAKQYDEACARHLLQTLATQDLLALAPGVETAPANPEAPAHD